MKEYKKRKFSDVQGMGLQPIQRHNQEITQPNYYQEYNTLLEGGMSAIMESTPGMAKVEGAIDEVYAQYEKDIQTETEADTNEFDDKLSECITTLHEHGFNAGYSAGWAAGTLYILKKLGADAPTKDLLQPSENLTLIPQ